MFLTLFLFILFIILFILSQYAGVRKIYYKRYFSQPGVFEGESVLLIEEIQNNYIFPLFAVDVEAFLCNELRLAGYEQTAYSMQQFVSRFFLPPFTRIKRSIKIECVKRGYYELDSVLIFTRWPGPNRHRQARASLYVYPRALPLGENNPTENQTQNLAFSEKRLFQDPFSFSGVRDYRPGDPFGSINYKATAKTNVLKVNNRDFFSSRNFMLYINFQMPSFTDTLPTPVYQGLMELSLRYAADKVRESIELGYNAGFAANCRALGRANHIRYPMGRGQEHYVDMLKEMAAIRITDGCSFIWLMRQDIDRLWNTEIYIMTAGRNREMDDIIGIFNNRGNHVTVMLLKEEDVLPGTG